MRVLGGIVKWGLGLLLVAVVVAVGWLLVSPPDLFRVGTAYSAKIVCSNVFLAGREHGEVLADDVQSSGHPLLRWISIGVDAPAGLASTRMFRILAPGRAVHRDGVGCASVPDGDVSAAVAAIPQFGGAAGRPDMEAPWPRGERADAAADPAVAAILDDPAMQGPGMRAIVVVRGGRIVGERYGTGFDAATPLLGWSMTKSVTAAIVGTLVAEGRLSLDQDGLFEAWSTDERSQITLADLLAMSSGLEFDEDYGTVTDALRMFYLSSDMAGYAADKPLVAAPGEAFNYSSGSSVMASRVWQDAFDDPAEALAWPRRALFEPLGMHSAVMETDARGTFVGSSYMYATARDWARFGLLMLREGQWEGRAVLPEGHVAWMREPGPVSGGEYGRGSVWLHGPMAGTPAGEDPDAGFDLPDDAYWFLGHDGQTTTVIPSRDLVVVRLGLTPSRLGYKPQAMVAALAALTALPQ